MTISKKILHIACARLGSLLADTKGSTLPILAFGLATLIGATGMAVDMGRAQLVQSKLSSSVDAAGLAAGASVHSTTLSTEVNKYIKANFPANYLGSTLGAITTSVNTDNTVITIKATASVPTTLTRVFGKKTMNVSASSEITRTNKGLELVMVLDNTGSMAGSKLTSLKTAANDLVDILYGNKTSIDNLWIGLVPFAQGVNIGSSRTSWVASNSFNWGTTSWMGCVDAREASNRDVTDDTPTTAKFPAYYWPCHTTNNAWYGNNSSKNNCTLSGSSTSQYKTLSTSLGPNKACSQAITPLTHTKSTIVSGINAMQAVGNTHIVLGAAWGWRLLSPKWRGLWGGSMNTDNLPLNYNTPLMNKAVVLMTDGDNTIDNSNRGAYGYLSDGKLGTTNSSSAVTQLNTRLTTVCNSLKANNIIVYTIVFGTPSTSVQNLIKGCATKPEYYFYSPDEEDLEKAFHMIGDSLSNLRVSK